MTVTLGKGSKREKQIAVSSIQIPDLWHIAQAELDLGCRHAILEAWHTAHDLRRVMQEDIPELLEACKELLEVVDDGNAEAYPATDSKPESRWSNIHQLIAKFSPVQAEAC